VKGSSEHTAARDQRNALRGALNERRIGIDDRRGGRGRNLIEVEIAGALSTDFRKSRKRFGAGDSITLGRQLPEQHRAGNTSAALRNDRRPGVKTLQRPPAAVSNDGEHFIPFRSE